MGRSRVVATLVNLYRSLIGSDILFTLIVCLCIQPYSNYLGTFEQMNKEATT